MQGSNKQPWLAHGKTKAKLWLPLVMDQETSLMQSPQGDKNWAWHLNIFVNPSVGVTADASQPPSSQGCKATFWLAALGPTRCH